MNELGSISFTDFLLITGATVALIIFIGYIAKEDTKFMRRWIQETEDLKKAKEAKEALAKEQAEQEKPDSKET